MKKYTIIILVLCAAILAVIAVMTLKEDPGISSLYISDSPTLPAEQKEAEGEVPEKFYNTDSDIYLVVTIRDLKPEDIINITWILSDPENSIVFQENRINPKKPGSGEIIIYLLKRNGLYPEGNYEVKVSLNDSSMIKTSFKVKN